MCISHYVLLGGGHLVGFLLGAPGLAGHPADWSFSPVLSQAWPLAP